MGEVPHPGRRAFLALESAPSASHVRPPGFLSSGLDLCTGCGACVEACPTGIVTLAEGKPALDFSSGECTFCGECASACPEAVFDRSARPSFSHVMAISDRCLPRLGIACMTCRDACPETAIRFRPRVGGPFLPQVDEERCTGCGACVAPCPAGAIAPARRGGGNAHA